MIENNVEPTRQRKRARRRGVVPSSSLRPHFLALARQVRQWSESRPVESNRRGVAIGVTALTKAAGKSTVAFNLASALTSVTQSQALLVESDFGKHFVTRRLGHSRAPGLCEMLLGVANVHETVFPTAETGLSVMGCGQKPPQAALELPFDQLGAVMTDSLSNYGFLVFDLPLADPLTACHSMLPKLDGVILTVESSQIDQVQINRFHKQLASQGVEIVGVVLNKA